MILPITSINFNSQNKTKTNNMRVFSKLNAHPIDTISFGSAKENVSKKVFAVVKQVFAELEDNSEFIGVHKELEIFQTKARQAAKIIKQEVFSLLDKKGQELSGTENSCLGKTEIIRYQDNLSKEISFDQRDNLKDKVLQKLIINPEKQTIEMHVFIQQERLLEKIAFYDFKQEIEGVRVNQYMKPPYNGIADWDSERSIGSLSFI